MTREHVMFDWTHDEILIAVKGLRHSLKHLDEAARINFETASRIEVHRLIQSKHINAANLLRLFAGTVEPERRHRPLS